MEIDNNKFYQLPTGSSSPLPNRGNINCWISTPFKVLICRMMSQLQRQNILMLSLLNAESSTKIFYVSNCDKLPPRFMILVSWNFLKKKTKNTISWSTSNLCC
jgi:hypothetical protein